MGLDAFCGRVSGKLGSYGWFHSYRMAINRLEDGPWGSVYPLVMDHSDCDGGYEPGEAKALAEELDGIKEGLIKLPYPVALYLGPGGNELGFCGKYGEDGIFACTGKWLLGVDEEGLIIARNLRDSRDSLSGTARLKRIAKDNALFEAWTSRPAGTEEIAHGSKPAYDVFRHTHDLFRDLARESEDTGEGIEFG
jgi:hypothetical protein